MNIFDSLNAAVPEGGEEVGGMFQCQTQGCFDIEEDAMYYPNVKRLEWTCEEGHKNTVEDFSID